MIHKAKSSFRLSPNRPHIQQANISFDYYPTGHTATGQPSHSIIIQQAIQPPGNCFILLAPNRPYSHQANRLIRLSPNRPYSHKATVSFDYHPTGHTATRQPSHSIITQQAIQPPGNRLIRLSSNRPYSHWVTVSFDYHPTDHTVTGQPSHSIITQQTIQSPGNRLIRLSPNRPYSHQATVSFDNYVISSPLCTYLQGMFNFSYLINKYIKK